MVRIYWSDFINNQLVGLNDEFLKEIFQSNQSNQKSFEEIKFKFNNNTIITVMNLVIVQVVIIISYKYIICHIVSYNIKNNSTNLIRNFNVTL